MHKYSYRQYKYIIIKYMTYYKINKKYSILLDKNYKIKLK